MPIYRVRLENESGEFRLVAVNAGSKEEARAICERQEQRHVGFYVDGEEFSELEKQEAEGIIRGREKARLLSHRQVEPYKIVSVKEG